MEHV
jgi:hypothetical protein